jgi:hypothetical protein
VTARSKAKDDGEAPEATSEAQQAGAEEAPKCGVPHFLPTLAHLTCTEPAPDPDRPPGTPDHQHRYQDGDALYVWR